MKREIGLVGAVLLGLGSIVGTGLFVSTALITEAAGHWVLYAVLLAGLLALANGLSSAQLAAAHPVSGGTYEYGYQYVHPLAGFSAGVLFMVAKSASAATAALGAVSYGLALAGVTVASWVVSVLALGTLGVMTLLVQLGIRRSNQANTLLVGVTLLALLALIAAALFVPAKTPAAELVLPHAPLNSVQLGLAVALAFVAFTGYGRVATLGEEVVRPERTIPLAVMLTLAAVLTLYGLVLLAGIGVLGVAGYAQTLTGATAPLWQVAANMGAPWLGWVIGAAAVTAMLGVLLNLVLGLSRVLLAMARRGDAPKSWAVLTGDNPRLAVWVTAGIIGVLVLIGDVAVTWSFSALTVLGYYAITNWAALRLPASARRYPAWVSWAGLAGCLWLTLYIPLMLWFWGAGLLIGAVVLRAVSRR